MLKHITTCLKSISLYVGVAVLGASLTMPFAAAHVAAAAAAECPVTISCSFVPAAYKQNSSSVTDYGNYDTANRPVTETPKYIVIHDTEGSYQGTISQFQNSTSYVSANYVIRSNDGAVTQMVQNKDVTWAAKNWYANAHAINIEHEGYANTGSYYTEAMYQSSAKLVRYLADKYGIPLDRDHIVAHDQVPGLSTATHAAQHWDPGPYWNWQHYMALVKGVSDSAELASNGNTTRSSSGMVTIAPQFTNNKLTFQDCSSGKCVNRASQNSSMVFVRTAPGVTNPLLSDKYLHPDNSAGTTKLQDWGSTATYGQTFQVAGQSGDWTAIHMGGKTGWFYNPANAPTGYFKAVPGKTVTAKSGVTVNVYGAAYPAASAYPSGVPVAASAVLYTMPAGQRYTVTDSSMPSDYYYATTFNSSKPYDHTVIKDGVAWYMVEFNHRFGFVKASDVTVQ